MTPLVSSYINPPSLCLAAFIKADGARFIRHSQLYQLRREVARLLPSLLFHYVYLLRFILALPHNSPGKHRSPQIDISIEPLHN